MAAASVTLLSHAAAGWKGSFLRRDGAQGEAEPRGVGGVGRWGQLPGAGPSAGPLVSGAAGLRRCDPSLFNPVSDSSPDSLAFLSRTCECWSSCPWSWTL